MNTMRDQSARIQDFEDNLNWMEPLKKKDDVSRSDVKKRRKGAEKRSSVVKRMNDIRKKVHAIRKRKHGVKKTDAIRKRRPDLKKNDVVGKKHSVTRSYVTRRSSSVRMNDIIRKIFDGMRKTTLAT